MRNRDLCARPGGVGRICHGEHKELHAGPHLSGVGDRIGATKLGGGLSPGQVVVEVQTVVAARIVMRVSGVVTP